MKVLERFLLERDNVVSVSSSFVFILTESVDKTKLLQISSKYIESIDFSYHIRNP